MTQDKEKLVTIPGELHSAATGNVVASTEEIYDYTLDSSQSSLNYDSPSYNVSNHHEHEVDGVVTNHYNFDEAVQLVPEALRVGGLKLTFISYSSDMESFIYKGTGTDDFTDKNNWGYIGFNTLNDNPEYIQVTLDSSNKIIEGIQENGMKYLSAGMNIGGHEYYVIENPEWIRAIIDSDNKILCGIKQDGKFYADFAGIDEQVQKLIEPLINEVEELVQRFDEIFKLIENPEYMSVELDSEDKVLGGRKIDGTKFENVGLDLGGAVLKGMNDPEGRMEIKTDSDEKIISYRKEDGTLVENIGIETNHLELTEEGQKAFEEKLINDGIEVASKNYFLPKFGTVNIKQETFYLTYDARYSSKSDIILIQMLDDTNANAAARRTLSYYYIKSTLTPLPGGGYDRTSVNDNSVLLDFYPAKEVVEENGHYYVNKITKVNGIFYFTSTLIKKEVDGQIIYVLSTETGGKSVAVNYEDITIADQTTLTNAIEVTQIKDVPPYKAWTVNKKLEHYCIADINFGSFYTKNNIPVSIKYQGSASTQNRMRGLRITFFKKNDYKKKDKIKIGEMIRLSGFNMKAYFGDDSMIKDPMLSNVFIEMWNTRGKEAYPWNKDSVPYSGATGFCKSFPIETYFGTEFYGIQFFSIKKDEKNYMLDGDDDNSGIFVTGNINSPNMWTNSTAANWVDEMGADGRELAYPDLGDDSVSVETAEAINELLTVIKGFINESISTNELEEHMDIKSFIDYWIGLQCFMLWDNEYHNMILYSGSDKTMFYPFFYDLDNSMSQSWAYNTDLVEACTNPEHHIHPYNVIDMSFWVRFIDEYKDSIINRYIELRKDVLSIDNITCIYNAYVEGIPSNVITEHQHRWNISSSPEKFKTIYIEYLKKRLEWLDETYFNLNV